MKVFDALRTWSERHGAPYAYLAFALLMLKLARRGADKHVVRDSLIGFFAAVVPTELAHTLLAVNAATLWYLLRRARAHVISSWVGSLAACTQAVAVTTFVRYHQRSLSAKQGMRHALQSAGIAPPSLHHLGDLNARQWAAMLLPIPQHTALSMAYPSVRCVDTVTFAHVGTQRTTKLRMDVYAHAHTPRNAPILLYVHGGAWVFGSRERAPLPLLYQIASRCWLVCSIDYRLSPKVAFPAHLTDVKRAVAFLRSADAKSRPWHGGDASCIVVAGESAGGHLASLTALTAHDKSLQPGFEDVDTRVQGCIDTYGVHDLRDRHGLYRVKDEGPNFQRFMELVVMQRRVEEDPHAFEVASPMSWLTNDALALDHAAREEHAVPPFMVAHGTHDTIVPFDESRLFFDKLQAFRARTRRYDASHGREQRQAVEEEEEAEEEEEEEAVADVFMELPGVHHAFNYMMSPRSLAYGDAVSVFLEKVYTTFKQKQRRSQRASQAPSTTTSQASVSVEDSLQLARL